MSVVAELFTIYQAIGLLLAMAYFPIGLWKLIQAKSAYARDMQTDLAVMTIGLWWAWPWLLGAYAWDLVGPKRSASPDQKKQRP